MLTGVDRLTLAVLAAEHPVPDSTRDKELLRDRFKSAVVALNEEAGELRMFAATYRATGGASR